MTTQTKRHKTFADVPAWNSGAAVGFVGGSVVGLLASAGIVWIPGLENHVAALTTNVVECTVAGSVVGAIAGAMVDLRAARKS